jgi:AcrR family transcriptional regulator
MPPVSPGPASPQQARSRRTLERLLASAEDLLGEVGHAGFTIPELSRRAGISIGTVYKRFATKEDLLRAVMQRVEQQETEILERWDDEDWGSLESRLVVERVVADLSRTWREHAPALRGSMIRRLQTPDDDPFLAQGLSIMSRDSERFRRVIMTHADELIHRDIDQAIDFAFRLIIAVCARWAARAIETMAPHPLTWDEMTARLSENVTAYLFGARACPVRPGD